MAKENARAGKANTNTGAGEVKKLTKAQIKKYEKTAQGKATKTAAKKATALATKETKVEAKADKKYTGKDNSKGDKPEAKKPAAKKVKKPAVKKPAAKKVKKPAAKKPAAKVQTGTAPAPTTTDPKVVKGKAAVEANKAKTEAKPKAKTKAVKTPAQRGVAAAKKQRATDKAKAVKAAKKLAKNSTKAAKLARYGGYALRAARIGTPIGAASLALEGLYRGGKYLKLKHDRDKTRKLNNDIAVKEGRGKYVNETTGIGRQKRTVKVFKPVNKQAQGKGDGSMLVRKDYKKPVSKPTAKPTAKPVAKPTVKPVAKPAVTPTPTKTTTVKKSRFGAGNDKTISRKGKKLANVSKEQLKASGLNLNKYMNQWNKTGKRP